ncbi:hypothetical protein LguiA_002915 [Lonicera macranthoides]
MIGVKKNPNSPMYTSLGVVTRGTIIEVNVSELGLVTPAGKVVWIPWMVTGFASYAEEKNMTWRKNHAIRIWLLFKFEGWRNLKLTDFVDVQVNKNRYINNSAWLSYDKSLMN